MCEMLVATFEEPRPFSEVAPLASGLEQLGVAGFGWGVAWLEEDAEGGRAVRVVRGLGTYRDEGHRSYALMEQASRRFMVHLRRPSRLSTVQAADTQPFLDGDRSAWCHNGYLERAEELRVRFEGRLAGLADSEVGWQFFLDRLHDGDDPLDALRAVDEAFGGRVNLAYLAADGELCVYSRNDTNRMWTFRLDDAVMAATDLHSADSSLFDLVVPRATDRHLLDPGSSLRLAGPTGPPPPANAPRSTGGDPAGDDGVRVGANGAGS
jgi:predicted glutamine amidotransferase